jgi:hypothetical protein
MNHNNGAGAWVIHHPSKCDRRDATHDKDKAGEKKALTLSKALAAIHEDSDNESSGEDE